jgi:hypothetical protein
MKSIILFAAILVTLTLVGWSTQGAVANTPPISGQAAFEVMKSLAGEWRGTAQGEEKNMDVAVTYRVTSAGSAVVETLFSGTAHEMITVYYLDGAKLCLTHYCAMANQPRMVLNKKSNSRDLLFDFAGGSNMNPKKDAHMHAAHLLVENPDAIRGEWTAYKDGKENGVTRFTLARTK